MTCFVWMCIEWFRRAVVAGDSVASSDVTTGRRSAASVMVEAGHRRDLGESGSWRACCLMCPTQPECWCAADVKVASEPSCPGRPEDEDGKNHDTM